MQRRIAELKSDRFDVLVVGGGITGAWIALDCVTRGLSVAVVDQGDFGSGTSAKSSRIVHGGIRYLQQFRLDKVRESAVERAYYHRAAPHLTEYLPFIVPTYGHGMKSKTFMRAGLALYDLLCIGEDRVAGDPAKAVPDPFFMTRAEVLDHCPITDPNLTGAAVYYESHMNSSERMTLAVLDTADKQGAVCANYVRAGELLIGSDQSVVGMVMEDVEGGEHFETRARLTINATGPWLPGLNRLLLENNTGVASTGLAQGSHLVTRQLVKDFAIALPTKFAGQNIIDRGGRHIFILPWRGCSLIGTSYVAAQPDINDPVISQEEIHQLMGEINAQLPDLSLCTEDIVHTFSGIYPLSANVLNEKTYQGTGDYQIIDHEVTGRKGIVSALGAKFTTARLVAEKVTNLAAAKLANSSVPCGTRRMPLSTAGYSDLAAYTAQMVTKLKKYVDGEQTERLVRQYGTGVEQLMQYFDRESDAAVPLCDSRPNLRAEVRHAVESEMAIRLDDVIYRRTGIGTVGFPEQDCIDRCAALMSDLLMWDAKKRVAEVQRLDRYRRHVSLL